MQRTRLDLGGVTVTGLNNVNVILGRNGAGKSRLLRAIDLAALQDNSLNVRYISPERAGVFRRVGHVVTNMEQNDRWLWDTRRQNQAGEFKAASAALLRDLESLYLRRLQDDPTIRNDLDRDFRRDKLDRINKLLSNVTIDQERADFVFRSTSGEIIPPEQISSGESETVALATELMYFFETLERDKFNLLLLDEPDVHLHPDLQARLANFALGLLDDLKEDERAKVSILLATHSTPLVCALATSEKSSVGVKDFGVDTVSFHSLRAHIRKVAPFFGHPLSLSLSNDVMVILEGEDDERVWQQAARASQGSIRLFPVLASSVDIQSDLERFTAPLLESLYDNPIAYSLRDGDGVVGDLPPVGCITRFRLHCYAIENALVTDECLAVLGTTWPAFQIATLAWIEANPLRDECALLQQLTESADRLRNVKIKKIRQLLCGIAGSNKPWEVVVGQAIAALEADNLQNEPSKLASFLGADAVRTLLTPQPVG